MSVEITVTLTLFCEAPGCATWEAWCDSTILRCRCRAHEAGWWVRRGVFAGLVLTGVACPRHAKTKEKAQVDAEAEQGSSSEKQPT